MILARVSGTVVMTIKHPRYHGEKLMAVEAIDEHGEPTGQSWLAVDRAQAGVGDTVLVLREGNGIRQIVGPDVPIRSLIVGVVDEVSA